MSSKVQLSGGAFQDPAGNVLANGYLLMVLSQDGQVNGDVQVASGVELKILLDSNGNVEQSPAQYVWPNDAISPANTFYTVSAYTAEGQLVWGPNSQQVFSTPSPYDVGVWVPALLSTTFAPVTTYDIGMFCPGSYLGSQILCLVAIERQVRFAQNLTPSTAACGTNPTASAVFSLNQNGIQFGTITISTSGTATFQSNGAVFNAGDVLTIVAPAATDSTLANVGIILSGTTLV